jgi:hypothetical protein
MPAGIGNVDLLALELILADFRDAEPHSAIASVHYIYS